MAQGTVFSRPRRLRRSVAGTVHARVEGMSEATTGENQPLEKFRDLMREFENAMLVSIDSGGHLHGRPMRIVAHDCDVSDDLWFVTGLDSEKIAEIEKEQRVAVTLADGKRFLSISGDAHAVVDPGKIKAMWQESWRLWFPAGPEGGGIALIQVLPLHAEYWDQSFPTGLRFAFEAAKAWLGKQKIEEPNQPEQHAKVRLA
jgi:general stress protein 26